jgi:hypothetical protein
MKKMSSFEKKISQILSKENIKFEREKQFKDFRQGLYRYDFYIPSKNILLEVNGLQHYKNSTHFFKTLTDFKKAQERDRRKISYALAKKIDLYIIPYWEIEKIESTDDIFKEIHLARTKFHNDIIYRTYKTSKTQSR